MTVRLASDKDTPPRPVVQLPAWQRMEVENARRLVLELEQASCAELAGPLGALWAGRLEGAARNLLDIIDYLTVRP